MSFKPKTNKQVKINTSDFISIDTKHNEMISKFNHNETKVLPKLIKEKESIITKLNTQHTLNDDIMLNNKMSELNKKIGNIKQEKNKYYLKNSQLLFAYFEEKKNSTTNNVVNKDILARFFNVNKSEIVNNKINKQLLTKYLINNCPDNININNYKYNQEVCEYCNVGELIQIAEEGILVCDHCYKQVQHLVSYDKPLYNDASNDVCFYAYKRINHFREILAQFQGKETTTIPTKLLDDLKLQINKERLELSQLNIEMMKQLLKKLGYNKYYEHIPFIKDRLGISPPVMSPEYEDKLCSLFMEIQKPYTLFCPDHRTNFLNYYYTIYKLCEILEYTEFLEYFPMLKDRSKIIEQDEIWRKICKELNWGYIPTIT